MSRISPKNDRSVFNMSAFMEDLLNSRPSIYGDNFNAHIKIIEANDLSRISFIEDIKSEVLENPECQKLLHSVLNEYINLIFQELLKKSSDASEKDIDQTNSIDIKAEIETYFGSSILNNEIESNLTLNIENIGILKNPLNYANKEYYYERMNSFVDGNYSDSIKDSLLHIHPNIRKEISESVKFPFKLENEDEYTKEVDDFQARIGNSKNMSSILVNCILLTLKGRLKGTPLKIRSKAYSVYTMAKIIKKYEKTINWNFRTEFDIFQWCDDVIKRSKDEVGFSLSIFKNVSPVWNNEIRDNVAWQSFTILKNMAWSEERTSIRDARLILICGSYLNFEKHKEYCFDRALYSSIGFISKYISFFRKCDHVLGVNRVNPYSEFNAEDIVASKSGLSTITFNSNEIKQYERSAFYIKFRDKKYFFKESNHNTDKNFVSHEFELKDDDGSPEYIDLITLLHYSKNRTKYELKMIFGEIRNLLASHGEIAYQEDNKDHLILTGIIRGKGFYEFMSFLFLMVNGACVVVLKIDKIPSMDSNIALEKWVKENNALQVSGLLNIKKQSIKKLLSEI